HTECILGNGMVIDPLLLLQEIDHLRERGIANDSIYVSDRAHVIMSYHKLQDQLEEAARGSEKIGTTGQGIGPAYADKVARWGIRMIDLVDEERFRSRLRSVLPWKNRMFQRLYDHPGVSEEELLEQYLPV